MLDKIKQYSRLSLLTALDTDRAITTRPLTLAYHSISQLQNDYNRVCISPRRFETHMRHLRRRGLQGVSLRKLHQAVGAGASKGLVALTFDDGYDDFLHTAVPILERFGFSATVFMVVGMLGQENSWEHKYTPRPRLKLLDADGLRKVSERGMEVGSHTMTHPRLSGIEPERLEREVVDSRRILREILGEEIQGFCYPYGSLNETVVQVLQGAGYSYACGVKTRAEYEAYDLPRVPLSQRDGYLRLTAKLTVYPQYSKITRPSN